MFDTIDTFIAGVAGVGVGMIMVAMIIGSSPEIVYYPNWDGSTMYYNKQDVIQLAIESGRDVTEIDSAYVK